MSPGDRSLGRQVVELFGMVPVCDDEGDRSPGALSGGVGLRGLGTPVSTSPLVEAYRADLRLADYARLSEDETARMADRFAVSHHSNAMAGVHPSPELAALFAMFVEERVPLPLAEQYFHRFMAEDAKTGTRARSPQS